MQGFGGVLVGAAVLVAICGALVGATAPGGIGVIVFFSAASGAFGLGAAGGALMCLGDIRDTLRELVLHARDDREFRRATWQQQTGAVPPRLPDPGSAPLSTAQLRNRLAEDEGR